MLCGVIASALAPATGASLLAASRGPGGFDVSRVTLTDGIVARRVRAGLVRRTWQPEVGAGHLVLEACSIGGEIACEVWGDHGTPAEEVERGLEACLAWAGLRDHPELLVEVVAEHPLARRLVRRSGEVRLSALPTVGEALGRSVLAQLVQGVEAARSTRQLVCLTSEAGPHGLRAWPAAGVLGRRHAHELRRCGISLRGAQALHAGALAEARLEEARHDDALLDRRLRALPGVGIWTSGETRLALGHPDAVSVGDWWLPSVVGTVLTGGDGSRPRHEWTDEEMLGLLAPFTGQRGRAIRLCERAAARRQAARPARRAPRAAVSRHRYW